jgi:hypothetical protein
LDKRDNRPAKGDGEPGEKIEMLLSPTSAGADKLFIQYGTSATDPAAQYCSHRKIQIGIASLLRIAVEPSVLAGGNRLSSKAGGRKFGTRSSKGLRKDI